MAEGEQYFSQVTWIVIWTSSQMASDFAADRQLSYNWKSETLQWSVRFPSDAAHDTNHAFAIEFNHKVPAVVSAEAVEAAHLPQTGFTLVLMFSFCPD